MSSYKVPVGALAAVFLAFALWCVLGVARHHDIALHSVCSNAASATSGCTAAYLITHDPYCRIDPTCISPNWDGEHGSGYWQGFAIMDDPELIYGNPIQMLAVRNFVLFAAAIYACLGVGIGVLRSPHRRRMLFVLIATFYILEVARWVEAVWRLSRLTVFGGLFLDPMTYLGIFVLLAPLGMAYYIARPALHGARRD